MKTLIKQLAAGTFIALLLLVGNIKAEGTELKASSLENIKESALEVENWMIDETVWNTNYVNNTEFVQETEESLELEDWMINAEKWNTVNNEIESEFKVEP